MRSSLWLMLLLGCAEKPDTAAPEDELTETVVIRDADYDTCERGAFWPSGMYPVLGYGLAPVAPPYEITHVGAELIDTGDGWCTADSGLKIQLWVGGDAPDTYPLKANGHPDLPEPLVEVTVAASAADTDGYFYAEVALDPPVRVEETGTLWVVAANYRTGGPDEQDIPCLGGCMGGAETAFQWGETDGWIDVHESLPLFQITVRH